MLRVAILLTLILAAAQFSYSQTESVRLWVRNEATKAGVVEAKVSVRDTAVRGATNAEGRVTLSGIEAGARVIEVFSPGYETAELSLTFPLADNAERIVDLHVDNEVGSVTITSTRTGREIEAEPTRVEAIDEEEIDEKISMRPANVSMVLSESTGIQVQQTSATSNTQTVRIQGLNGRYTQLLKDGFPAYGGFSGTLSLLDIPPLDLKQVEIIKGPSATLFGGDAIAGVVNFVSKEPEEERVTSLVLNQTTAFGTDFSIFNSRKFERVGYTLLGSANYQRRYDVDDDDFTELPDTKALTINPRLFFFPSKRTTLSVGNSLTYQDRKGGDVFVLRGSADGFHQYFEQNTTVRNISTFNLSHDLEGGGRLFVKQSFSLFDRQLDIPNYGFGGRQFNAFTDVSVSKLFGKHAVIFGGSAVFDRFREDVTPAGGRNENRTAVGAFVQDTVDLTDKISLEAGLRIEATEDCGTFALPRASLLVRLTENLTSRVGFGFGYKAPTMFTEGAEELLFRGVAGIGDTLEAEKSRGGTFDLNYRRDIGEKATISINQMFFYTQITDPVVLRLGAGGIYRFFNDSSSVVSKGFETNARFTYGITKLFVGYTFTSATAGYLPGTRRLALISPHRVNSSLVWEKHDSFKAGIEFYYGSRQTLVDRSLTPRSAEVGLFGEKTFGRYRVFVNAENIFDERQSRNGPVVLGPHQSPTFAEIYTHTEGRVFNGGVKITF